MNTPLAAQLLLAWSESLNHTPRSFADWLEWFRGLPLDSVERSTATEVTP